MGAKPTIINTRSGQRGDATTEFFESRGYAVCRSPFTKQSMLIPKGELLARVAGAAWLVVLSPRAAACICEQVEAEPRLADDFRIAALADATASVLRAGGIVPSFVGQAGHAQGFAAEFLPQLTEGEEVISLQSQIGLPTFARALVNAGVAAKKVEFYQTTPDQDGLAKAKSWLREQGSENTLMLISSPSGVRAMQEFGFRARCGIVSIGPTTSAALRDAGYQGFLEAPTPSNEGFLAAIEGKAKA